MKIMQVNCVYGEKSTGKLVRVLHNGISEAGHESVVVYGRGSDTADSDVIRLNTEIYGKLNSLRSRITGLPYGGCEISTSRLISLIKTEKPDLVHLQCINGNFVNIYRLINWLKKSGIPTALTLHAEFMYTANCGHAFDCNGYMSGCSGCPDVRKATKSRFFDRTSASWEKMRRAFEGFDNRLVVVSVSDWLRHRAQSAPILKPFCHETILNCVDTDIFRLGNRNDKKEKTVLHVTASFDDTLGHPKGGYYVFELAKRLENCGVRFQIASGSQNIHGEIPSNVELLGNVSDQQRLAKLYSDADVTLVTGKRETFSMPCAESLCCGTPVVGFQAGAPEQISLKEYSEFVPYGDTEALQSALENALEKSHDREMIVREAERAYSTETMINAYLKLYEKLIAES